ncbi:hypothetical protein [Streptomyces sp. NBC_01198]|nr:hypothetical protein OG702_35000 [Streptomyces sp. NBC_01198]
MANGSSRLAVASQFAAAAAAAAAVWFLAGWATPYLLRWMLGG